LRRGGRAEGAKGRLAEAGTRATGGGDQEEKRSGQRAEGGARGEQ